MAEDVKSSKETLEGSVKSVVFHNEQSGYVVLHVELPSDFELAKAPVVTVVGKTQAVWEGEDVRAVGEWVTDPQHGRQFRADELTCIAPRSLKGIERYLASGLIRGVGPVIAKRIVETFGDETMHVLQYQSARLSEVPKLGKAKIAQIRESWHANETMRENMIFGQTYGISILKMTKIVRKYGPDAVAIIKADPYRLCRDIWGIGFSTADKIALSVGISPVSPLRARASISYTLEREAEDNGHCWTFESDLLLRANELTSIPVEVLSAALAEEVASGRVVMERAEDGSGMVFLRSLYVAEKIVASRVMAILSAKSSNESFDAEKAVLVWQNKQGFRLAEMQSCALEKAFASKFSVITGGPGVGKTTIIRALAEIFASKGRKVVLAAPTGRAAKRMSESVGMPAATIHRLLKWNPAVNKFTFNAKQKLEGDVFVFDETSMIDVKLAAELLVALSDEATVVWVGDTDQLPSVGAGSVLGDLIKSSIIPSTRLELIFRQDTAGLIVANAHHVNAGESLEVRQGDTDFYFIRCEDPAMCVKRAIEFMTVRIPRKFGMDPMQDVQVLVPMRKNVLGADNLNFELQKALNPTGDTLSRGGSFFRVGDRVMQLRNNYDKDVYNGDVGFVKAIDPETRSLTVLFDGRPVRYESADLDEIVLAYATTIHKSQGSEYPAVVIIVHTQHYVMLQRNLLYTAITRGKKLVLLIGVPYAVDRAISVNSVRERRTSLVARLAALEEGKR